MGRARGFYGDVLGLELAEEGKEEGVLVYKTDTTRLVVYQSQYAGTNRANAVLWGFGDDLDAIVAALEAKGAAFDIIPTSAAAKPVLSLVEGATSTASAKPSWSG